MLMAPEQLPRHAAADGPAVRPYLSIVQIIQDVGLNTNHHLDLDFYSKIRNRRDEQQVIQLLDFAFLPAW